MNKSKVPMLRILILDGNALPYLYPKCFKCLPALQSINLDANRLTVLRNNTFSELPQLKKVFFRHNYQLKTIEPTAFNSTSLISIYFGNNNFRFDRTNNKYTRFNAEHIFKHSPSLQILDLTNNYLPSEKTTLGLMFAHLDEMTYLMLQAVGLKELHPSFFRNLTSLEKLNLEGNFINSWAPETFASLRSIQYINLRNNLIHVLNKSSLTENILNQLEQLNLAKNPFTCTCDLMWFRNWIRTTKVDLGSNFPRAYTCNFPAEMRGRLVIKYNPTTESCEQSDPFKVVAIILSSFAFLVIIVILLVYKGHTYIRNYCYIIRLHRLRKQGYLRLNNRNDFEFHAFVVYCDADREWVHNEFIKRMENEQIKLCVHHREFEPGVPITENIDKYMNKSWKVVIIMSNDFASSDWCQWECDYVQERRRRQGKDACVLIMLKAIDAYHMTSGIRSLLHTTPYLRYKKGIGEALFWQAVLNTLRRPLSVPPMIVTMMMHINLMCLFGWGLQIVKTRINTTNEYCFKSYCTYNETEKSATCTGLDYVPHVPRNVEKLELSHNNFSDVNISRWFLSNITGINIKEIKLIGNSIKVVESDVFVDFVSLTTLTISDEKQLNVTSLCNALIFVNTTRLKRIHLYKNYWNYIPFDVFEAISLRQVTSISLENNQLATFKIPDWYTELRNLKTINLSDNNIIHLNLYDNVTLLVEQLDLSRNDFVRIPTFCNKMKRSQVPKLRSLILNGNAIRYLYPKCFSCMPSLQNISLHANRLTILRNNTFSDVPQLKHVFFQFNYQLKTIQPMAFNSTSLISIHFGYNNFRFDKTNNKNARFNADQIFKHTPSLQFLDLTNNYLPSDKTTLGLMFAHLDEMKYLILQAVCLTEIHPNLFRNLTSLEKIILQGNFISSWAPETFDNMRSIKYINLRNNLIHTLNKSSLSENILYQLEKLDLAKNPFTCTCDLMWFRNWVRTTEVNLSLTFPKEYICNFPAEMRGRLLIEYNPTPESCEPTNPFIVIATILSTFTFVVIVVILLAYKGHTYIRNCCYILRLHRLRKQGYLRLNNSDDFEFHAFVVYCDADREWVHSEFIKRMEHEQIKLCVHHREFDPGVPITENIDRYMNKSWKVVIIMSNDFASSDWCQWECDYVQERRRRQGKDACVLIMLKAIDAYHMTSGIRSLVHTTPYLRYKKGIGEALFWQAVLNTLRKPLSVPPMAI
ncbi:toll-like receptor 13 [Mytilus trossulus]|uniref:toll-like receptor 13 n=1 Tax=Mytilus trossulus TaxID=6551 RepID=UPI003004A85D